MLTKEILPEGFSTSFAEQGLKARFYPDGQLQEYGYYWAGEHPACGWILYLGHKDMQARVVRRKRYAFPEDEEGRFDPEDAEQVERSWCDWLEGWIDSIVEKAHSPKTCSFCNKGREEVFKIVAGPAAMICDECVAFCQDLVAEENAVDESRE
ncbi:MAG TPA: ClpX C4-type zinc finger protein [Candidatus Melainabacteria bacterium]|nr:ClpX C4-type zinc finger protein [Candidatus Melainabacteria bacterium]